MKKRMVLTAMLAALCASLFAQGASEKATAGKTTDANAPTKIVLWYPATQTEVGPTPNDWVGYQVIKDKFNIDLEAQTLPSGIEDQDMKIQAAAAADDLPDFFSVSRDVWVHLVDIGVIADVSSLYAKMPERTKIMFDQDAINYTSIGGKSYGFATPSGIVRNEGLAIRQDWLDKLGLQAPKTLDEWVEVMKAFTFNDPDGNGKKDTYGFGAFVEIHPHEYYPGRRFEPLMGAFGVEGTWNMTKENFGLNIHKPEFYDFMVFLKKQVIDQGLIDPNWMAYKKDDFRGAWKQGKFGCFREQNAALTAMNNYAPFDANFPDGSFTIIDGPTGPTGKSSIGPAIRSLRIWAISQRAMDQGKGDKIAEMFNWMSYGEGYRLVGWGREGIEYEMKDGIPVSKPGDQGFEGPVGQTYTQMRNMAYNYASDDELKSIFPTYVTAVSHKTMSALDTLHEMQRHPWTDATGEDSMPVPSTDLKTYYEQGLAEFLTGKRELTKANWASFIKQLDQIGATAWEEAGRVYAEQNNLLK